MPQITKTISAYEIHYYSVPIIIAGESHSTYELSVRLLGSESLRHVGKIKFSDEFPVRQNYVDTNVEPDFMVLHYHISQFSDIINILRHERPVAFLVTETSYGGILTSAEPVGEQE